MFVGHVRAEEKHFIKTVHRATVKKVYNKFTKEIEMRKKEDISEIIVALLNERMNERKAN